MYSYRYAWAERAAEAGYPERFAQASLGHTSVAIHRSYAKKAKVEMPPLEEFERAHAKVIPMPTVTDAAPLPATSEG